MALANPGNMIIDVVADLHGCYPSLKGGDLLLLCGDYTASDKLEQWAEWFAWLKKQNYAKKIMIAGNHDNFLQRGFSTTQEQASQLAEVQDILEECGYDFEYLCDSGTEFQGLKIWGSPWSVMFGNVNPRCKAFMARESKLEQMFKQIPEDTDILLTHTPPYLIMDENKEGLPCGSLALRQQLDTRIFPKFHFFGHIHEHHGKKIVLKRSGCGSEKNTRCFNVSYVDQNYKPMHKVRRVEI